MAENLSTLSSTGTEGTPTGTGARYVLMSTWEAAQQTDLVAAGDTAVLECYGFDLDDNLGIDGWTTDATHFITIKGVSTGLHGGVSRDNGGTGFRIYSSTNGVFRLSQQYTVIQDIEIKQTSTGTAISQASGSGQQLIERCLIYAPSVPATSFACGVNAANTTGLYYNCFIKTSGRGIELRSQASPQTKNCTIHATGSHGVLGGTHTNTFVGGTSSADFLSATTTYCASEDTTSTGTGAVTGVVFTDGVDFVEPSAGNYQATSTGKLADPAGTDLSEFFDDDITGTLR